MSVKSEREDKIRSNATNLLGSSSVTCQEVSVFLGRVNSTSGAIPLARARVRCLQWEFLASCTAPHMFDNEMALSSEVKSELSFWATLPVGLSSPITLASSVGTVTTDASDTGLGISFDGHVFSEEIPKEFLDFHINVKELFTLKRFLDLFPEVKNCVIT